MSLTQIVQTAIDIADKEGLQALSMNRIASALGFTAMSLYRYISSKDDLLMQDTVCDIPIPRKIPQIGARICESTSNRRCRYFGITLVR